MLILLSPAKSLDFSPSPVQLHSEPELLDEADQDRNTYLDVITDEVNRLNGVVSQFLTYARPIKPSTDGVDVNEVLEKTLTLLHVDDNPCSITFEGAPNLPAVRAEAELIRQITLNLARNAMEAMGEQGGELVISTSLTRRRTDRASAQRDRLTFVRIRFADEGPGIPPDARDKVFERFHSDRPEAEGFGNHSGLGLAIGRTIAEAHGGMLSVHDRPDGEGGACLVLDLPAMPDDSLNGA